MEIIIFQKINSLAGVSPFLDAVIWFISFSLSYALALFLLLILIKPKIFGIQTRLPVALALAAAFFSRFVIKEIILLFYNKPRPFDILDINTLVEHSSFGSFPSGHAIFFFTLSAFLIFYHKKLGVFFFTTSILIGISRIAAGLHWPSDILAGASLGILVGVGAFILSEKITLAIKNRQTHPKIS